MKSIHVKNHIVLPGRLLLVLLLIALVTGVVNVGCDLFSTRDPESPTGTQSGNEIANSPDEVIEGLSNAVALRDPDLFMLMIDSAFSYNASPSAYPDDPAAFDDWGYEKENAFARRLLNNDLLPAEATAELEFTIVTENLSADTAFYQETYRLELDLSREDLPQLYEGLADLKIIRSADGGWKVITWQDEVGGEAATMSRLRAAL